jgi:hypothetical protein
MHETSFCGLNNEMEESIMRNEKVKGSSVTMLISETAEHI